jgi:hypothetical protein
MSKCHSAELAMRGSKLRGRMPECRHAMIAGHRTRSVVDARRLGIVLAQSRAARSPAPNGWQADAAKSTNHRVSR